MKHGEPVPIESLLDDDDFAVLRMDNDERQILAGLTTPIGLYRLLYPCECEGEVCECDE